MQQLSWLGSKPGLERIESLLQEMGNPQRGLKYVHIAGTNGKGSTSLIIADILIKAGYRVGRFTSPHLHSYLERFTIDGVEITAEIFKSILDGIEKHIQTMLIKGEEHPTEFEVLTAIAFQYFQNEGVDIVVLEVGMGGSYDSTNVITPLVGVITGVDFDHTAFLGTTLGEIAANKAGIIKPGVPVVIGMMDKEALEVIKNKAQLWGAQLYHSDEISISPWGRPDLDNQTVNIEGPGLRLTGIRFSLRGDYQLRNLAVALRALLVMQDQGYAITEQYIRNSLAGLKMPGRLEVVKQSPLVIIDAAHNSQGAGALANALDILLPGRSKVLVLGLLDDKDREGILSALGRNTRMAIVTRPQGTRSQAWHEVEKQWRQKFPDIEVTSIQNITAAVEAGLATTAPDEYLLITGSFYVLDQARRVFMEN